MGQFRTFMSWYRLKSDPKHLYLKLSAAKFIDEQPVSMEDADAFSEETIEASKEMHEILATDNRLLVVKLDLRGMDYTQLHILPFVRYVKLAASQGMDIAYFEVWGAGEYWTYVMSFTPKYLRDRMILVK
jgi:endo-alpha-1,4-polygalactosaminidase (GH114 family)